LPGAEKDRSLRESEFINREPSFAHRIAGMSKLFRRVFRSRINKEAITDGEWGCLRALWDADNISQRELADKLDISTAAAVFWVNALERDGLAKRFADKTDKRKVVLRLTAKGKRMRDRIRPEIAKVHAVVFEHFSREELEQFSSMLDRMETALAEMYLKENGVPIRGY
jgi:DNA-binding MarR family transcriptional regulator